MTTWMLFIYFLLGNIGAAGGLTGAQFQSVEASFNQAVTAQSRASGGSSQSAPSAPIAPAITTVIHPLADVGVGWVAPTVVQAPVPAVKVRREVSRTREGR